LPGPPIKVIVMCEFYLNMCINKNKNKCCGCGKFVKKKNQKLRVDPYAKAIARIEVLHIICDACYFNLIDSI